MQTLCQTYDIKVPIQDDLRKCLIFGLQARPPIGVILSFFDYRNETVPIMQQMSHGTRAFIINANGLMGFLKQINVVQSLERAEQDGRLKAARKYHQHRLTLVELNQKLIALPTVEQQFTFLSGEFPSLFILMLKEYRLYDRLEKYMQKCRQYENDPQNFSIYVHGYFLPWLDLQREAGRLKHYGKLIQAPRKQISKIVVGNTKEKSMRKESLVARVERKRTIVTMQRVLGSMAASMGFVDSEIYATGTVYVYEMKHGVMHGKSTYFKQQAAIRQSNKTFRLCRTRLSIAVNRIFEDDFIIDESEEVVTTVQQMYYTRFKEARKALDFA